MLSSDAALFFFTLFSGCAWVACRSTTLFDAEKSHLGHVICVERCAWSMDAEANFFPQGPHSKSAALAVISAEGFA